MNARAWLEARLEGGPQALRPHVAECLEGDGEAVISLAVWGSRALEPRGGDEKSRQGAFRLLAADALITYACEAAADEEDVEAALNEVFASVLGRSR